MFYNLVLLSFPPAYSFLFLRFADDTDALAEEETELEILVESLNRTCTRYETEKAAEKINNDDKTPMTLRWKSRRQNRSYL